MTKPKLPQFSPGKRAGYDPATRRWRLTSGRIVSKAQFHQLTTPAPDGAHGFFLPQGILSHPESDRWAKLEHLVASGNPDVARDLLRDEAFQSAAERVNYVAGFMEPDPLPPDVRAEPIPSQMRSAYNLTNFYFDSAGDVAQHVEAPIDIAIDELEYEGPLRDEVEALYGADRLDMQAALFQIWYSASKYGVAYPFEAYDVNGKTPTKIVMLPPRHMWVGYQVTSSAIMPFVTNGQRQWWIDSPYRLRPLGNEPVWTEALVKTYVQPLAYGPTADRWNEQIPAGNSWGLALPMQNLSPVRGKAMAYERYPMPPIARAFTPLSTRVIFQEMRRATLEGFRSQLWLFTLGTKDAPPSPEEMEALKAALTGASGERTGMLAWRFGLEGKVLVPEALQNVLANETSMLFTLEIFRALGSSVRLVTGNPVSISGQGGQGIEVDLSLWLRRLEFIRRQVLAWEYGFRLRYAARQSASMLKDMRATKVRFSKSLLEVSERIKLELQPMYMMGLYSPQTALKGANQSYETELANKKAAKPDAELFIPTPTYNQTATGAGGQTTTSKTAPQGRPADVVNPNKLKAAWEDDPNRQAYFDAVSNAFKEDLLTAHDPQRFIDHLQGANLYYLRSLGLEAYRAAGGAGQPPEDWLRLPADFVNSYAGGFLEKLKSLSDYSDPALLDRALLYPQEGYKMAILGGQAWAMSERGATSWKRIAKDTACPDCKADALVMHAMSEPFRVMHPNENCLGQELYVQYFTGGLPSVEIPIPGAPGEFDELVAGKLGVVPAARSRRKRPA